MTACGGGAPPPDRYPDEPRAIVAMRPHVVQPYQLIVRGTPEVGVARAWIAAYGRAWLRLDGEPHAQPGWRDPTATNVAVAEQRDDRVRIVHDEDDARVLV